MATTPEKIEITTEFIRLDAFLKFAAVVATGGEAKLLVQEGGVKLNGEVCLQRTRKIRPGDTIEAGAQHFVVGEAGK